MLQETDFNMLVNRNINDDRIKEVIIKIQNKTYLPDWLKEPIQKLIEENSYLRNSTIFFPNGDFCPCLDSEFKWKKYMHYLRNLFLTNTEANKITRKNMWNYFQSEVEENKKLKDKNKSLESEINSLQNEINLLHQEFENLKEEFNKLREKSGNTEEKYNKLSDFVLDRVQEVFTKDLKDSSNFDPDFMFSDESSTESVAKTQELLMEQKNRYAAYSI